MNAFQLTSSAVNQSTFDLVSFCGNLVLVATSTESVTKPQKQ